MSWPWWVLSLIFAALAFVLIGSTLGSAHREVERERADDRRIAKAVADELERRNAR